MASRTVEDIAEYIKKMRFKKGFYGIKPASVWKKIEDLNEEYKAVFQVQEIAYEARIKEREDRIAELEHRIAVLEGKEDIAATGSINGFASGKRRKYYKQLADISSFLTHLALMLLLLYGMFFIFFGISPVKNDDMKPRLSAGDVMLYYRLEKKILPSDVLVYRKDGKQFVGRVIGQPGDTIDIPEDGGLSINGNIQVEDGIFYDTERYDTEAVKYPITLKENEYFLMSDMRSGGKDSRLFGPVTRKEIKGKVITVLRRSSI